MISLQRLLFTLKFISVLASLALSSDILSYSGRYQSNQVKKENNDRLERLSTINEQGAHENIDTSLMG